jgi:hypothetical protein
MERGLFWLSLLLVFLGLAWMGWNEYQKIEAYRRWAENFERAKYDIYAVLGQKGNTLTVGKPTRSGPVELQTFSLRDVQEIRLLVRDRPVPLESPPHQGTSALEFIFANGAESLKVPFTDITLAVQWGKYLQGAL